MQTIEFSTAQQEAKNAVEDWRRRWNHDQTLTLGGYAGAVLLGNGVRAERE
jgi:hypothetical protein